MNLRKLALFAVCFALSTAASSAKAELVVCTKNEPQWAPIMDNNLGDSGEGPAIIINEAAGRVTWIGTGGYIRLTGEQTSKGVKITRIDGRPGQEKILSTRKTGNVTDYELEDSLGGTGLLRVQFNGSPSGSWQHATDSMRQNFAFCTKNVLE